MEFYFDHNSLIRREILLPWSHDYFYVCSRSCMSHGYYAWLIIRGTCTLKLPKSNCSNWQKNYYRKLYTRTVWKDTYLPIRSCSRPLALGRIWVQISMVNSVEAELNIEVKSLIRAESMTESIMPRIPFGRYSNTSFGYAELEQDTREPQNLKHSSGSTHPTSSGNRMREIIPAKKKGGMKSY